MKKQVCTFITFLALILAINAIFVSCSELNVPAETTAAEESQVQICQECGATIPHSTKFCSECGSSIASETTSEIDTTVVPDTIVVSETTKTPENTVVPETTRAPETTSEPKTTSAPENTEASHSHTWSSWVTTLKATCTEEGKQERTCTCGKKETKSISAIGHTEVIDKAVSATCEIDGKTEGKHCSICNTVLAVQQIVKATGHQYGEWKTTKVATCTVKGAQQRFCRCGSIETTTIAIIEHHFVNGKCSMCGQKQPSDNINDNPSLTTQYGGIEVTKMPYSVKGIIVNKISFNGVQGNVTVINNTGYAISSMTNVAYKCYDSNGTILKTGSLFLEDMNNGESAEVYFYVEKGTSKILFGDVTIYKGEATTEDDIAIYEGIKVNKLPYEVKGISINSISLSSTKVTVTVTNKTGYAISSMTNVAYKCYDSNGTILKTGNLYFEDMNSDESAEVYFYIEKGTSKILFGDVAIYKGEATNEDDIAIYEGVKVNKLPYEVKGISINSISFNSTMVTVTATNKTGYAISSMTNVAYKCYDSNGTILKTGSLFFEDMNNGESVKLSFYIEKGTSKILFGDTTIYKGEATSNDYETATYDGVIVNKLPYEVKGIKLDSISFNSTEVLVIVTNKTGYAIDSMTSITYKCYDSDGTILKTGSLFLEDMNNGEAAKVTFYMEKGTSKILFGDVTVYKGETTSDNFETSIYEGVTVNKLPYEVTGIQINSISINGTKVTVIATNNTGYAISSMTSVAYKCYDANGIIVDTGSLYLEDMNNGESAEVYIYIDYDTSKLIFFDSKIYKQ